MISSVGVRASAGTGKTHYLVERLVELVARGVSPARVTATTFTRAAAGEIRSRALVRAAEILDDARVRREAFETLGLGSDEQRVALEALGALVADPLALDVTTLDALLLRMAQRLDARAGRPVAGEVVGPETEDTRLARAAERAIDHAEEAAVGAWLSLVGRGAVRRSALAQLREVGSQLRDVLDEVPARAWPPIVDGIDPSNEDEATARLRIAAASDPKLGPQLLEEVATLRSGDQEAWWTKGVAAKARSDEPTYRRRPIHPDLIAAVGEIDALERQRLRRALAIETASLYALGRAIERASDALARTDAVTTIGAATKRVAEADAVDVVAAARVDHLLVDELQDTSVAQWRALAPIAEETGAHADGSRSLFVVGDPKQAIYQWRGGASTLFPAVRAALPALRWEQLDRSHRSHPVVLEVVNRLFGTLTENIALAGHRVAARRARSEFVTHESAVTLNHGRARIEVGVNPLARTVECVQQMLASDLTAIGVLVRTNEAAERVARALEAAGTSVTVSSAGSLADEPDVRGFIAALGLVESPADRIARATIEASGIAAAVGLASDAAFEELHGWASDTRAQVYAHGIAAVLGSWVERAALERRGAVADLLLVAAHADLTSTGLRAFIERARATSAPTAGTHRVRVMTIHQAKGLEFDGVILTELSQPMIGSQPLLLLERDRETLEVLHAWRSPTPVERIALPELHAAVSAWEADAIEESLAVLYVAVTRAARELVVILEPSRAPDRSARRGVPTFADVVAAAFIGSTTREPGAVLFDASSDHT